MTIFLVKIFLHKSKRGERLIRILAYFLSLNIDMKIIRPVKSSGCMFILTWTLGLCSKAAMWWILGKYSTRIQLAHHQLCPKFCIAMNFWTTSTGPPRKYSIVGSRSSFQSHNTESENTYTFARERLMTASSQSKTNVSMQNNPN